MSERIRWFGVVISLLVASAEAQDRYELEAMGWSFEPPSGWVEARGATLEAIRQDLRQGPSSVEVLRCWAMNEPGSLPRIVLTATEVVVENEQAAADLVASLGAAASEDRATRFSLSSGLASFDGEVIVLTEGMVGSTGVVQLIGYTREAAFEDTRSALDSMIRSADFQRRATLSGAPKSGTSRVVDWGIRGAVIGAMIAVIIFGIRVLRAMWSPAVNQNEA